MIYTTATTTTGIWLRVLRELREVSLHHVPGTNLRILVRSDSETPAALPETQLFIALLMLIYR